MITIHPPVTDETATEVSIQYHSEMAARMADKILSHIYDWRYDPTEDGREMIKHAKEEYKLSLNTTEREF